MRVVKKEQQKHRGHRVVLGHKGTTGSPGGKIKLCTVSTLSQPAFRDSYLSVTISIKNTNSVKSHQAEMSLLLIMKSLTCSDSS